MTDHECCAEKLEGKLDKVHKSQIRMEQKAESSWDPAAQQTWKNKKTLERARGAVIWTLSILGLLGLTRLLTWASPFLFGGG